MSDVILSDYCFVSEPIVLDTPAPNFTAEGYYCGERQTFKLSDYRKRWVVLFFYAADFTFV